ncbi:UDP-glucose 4-epimerase GalE [Bradyrhizobium diazoefficiens]|nr:UDP-glucose 4-epimerase GalE [Bradyrhizobium diazoefficiens]MBR0848843.1 UDP-glucose 4-epimerase GalE [Bradyrhizobium diazoefficiens]
MSIMITGGAGYVGSHLAHALNEAGERVVVLDNLSTGFRASIPGNVPLIAGSIGDMALVTWVIAEYGIRTIFHCAAATVVPDSLSDPVFYYRNNTFASLALIEAAIAGGVEHFVFSSTAAVYGNTKFNPVREDALTLPTSPYGSSKLVTELMIEDIAKVHPIKYAALRYFNVAGADPALRTGQSGRKPTNLIKVAVQAALGISERVQVFGNDYDTPDGTCIRDYIHVSDLVRAHMNILDYLRGGGENITLNCGYGHGYSVLDVIAAVKSVSRTNFPIVYRERRAGDPAAVVADVSNLNRLLCWKPMYDDLEAIVAHTLAWERALLDRKSPA